MAARRTRQAEGSLILRNDDLDQQRSRREYYDAMLEDLRWLGMEWHEGPDIGGPFAPYSQSERSEHYRTAWQRLAEGGWLYPCRCSRRELAMAASAPHEQADEEPVYPGTCRPPHATPVDAGAAPSGLNWRFRVPEGEVVSFVDGHFGTQQFVAGRDFGDFLVWRRDDVPSYQLACVADDSTMGITEVVRGADLLLSTARQILLYRALGLTAPQWFHCPLMTDEHGTRLAKRHDALAIRTLRAQGRSAQEIIRESGL